MLTNDLAKRRKGFEKQSSQLPNEPKNNILFLNFHILTTNLFLGGLSMKNCAVNLSYKPLLRLGVVVSRF